MKAVGISTLLSVSTSNLPLFFISSLLKLYLFYLCTYKALNERSMSNLKFLPRPPRTSRFLTSIVGMRSLESRTKISWFHSRWAEYNGQRYTFVLIHGFVKGSLVWTLQKPETNI